MFPAQGLGVLRAALLSILALLFQEEPLLFAEFGILLAQSALLLLKEFVRKLFLGLLLGAQVSDLLVAGRDLCLEVLVHGLDAFLRSLDGEDFCLCFDEFVLECGDVILHACLLVLKLFEGTALGLGALNVVVELF